MSADYMERKCGECLHLEAMDFAGMEAKREHRCRERLHVVPIPGPRGMGLAMVFPTLPPEHPACGMFAEKEAGGRLAGLLSTVN